MKKIVSVMSVFLAAALLLPFGSVFAETTETAAAETVAGAAVSNDRNEQNSESVPAQKPFSAKENVVIDKLKLSIYAEHVYNLKPQNIVFGIYSEDKEFLGAEHAWVADTDKTYELNFNLPERDIGEILYLKCFSGAHSISHAGAAYKTDEFIPVNIKDAADAGKSVFMSAIPLSSQTVTAYANGWELYFKNPAKVVDGVCMVSLTEYLDALRMRDAMIYNKNSGRIEIEANYHKVLFFVNGNDMYADGEVTYSETTPLIINGAVYVPFRFLVEGLGGTITAEMKNDTLNVSAAFVRVTPNKSEARVAGITSRTDYLIWVSKSDFKVTLFKKRGGMWREEGSYSCSIGANATPTVEGQFEYFSKEKSWDYPTYYVGPIMRFYRGYALHSTLLRYSGAVADGRLGKKISHGCVRLAPKDINYLVDTVPLYTKVYVTP